MAEPFQVSENKVSSVLNRQLHRPCVRSPVRCSRRSASPHSPAQSRLKARTARKVEARDERNSHCAPRATSSSRPTRAPGSRSTCPPMDNASCSTSPATSTRCRSPAARRHASPTAWRSTRNRAGRRTGSRSSSSRDRDGSDDVWVMDADGKNPRQITRSDRDAVRVAGVDARRQVHHRVAEQRAVRHELQPLSLPQGWRHRRPDDRRAASRARAGHQRAAPATAAQLRRPAFGKDARYVYASSRMGGAAGYNQTGFDWHIVAYDRETGETSTRAAQGGGAFKPVLSPDGKWMVYATRADSVTSLRIRDMESGDEHVARARRAARRHGVAIHARPPAEHVVHAGLARAHRGLGRQDPRVDVADRSRRRRSRSRRTSTSSSERCPSSTTRSTTRRSRSRRSAARVRRPTASASRSPRSTSSGSWTSPTAHAAPPDPIAARSRRAFARLVAGRPLHHVRDLDRAGRRHLSHRGDGHRRARAAHPPVRVLHRRRTTRRTASGIVAYKAPRQPRLEEGFDVRPRAGLAARRGRSHDVRRALGWRQRRASRTSRATTTSASTSRRASSGLVSMRFDGTDRKTAPARHGQPRLPHDEPPAAATPSRDPHLSRRRSRARRGGQQRLRRRHPGDRRPAPTVIASSNPAQAVVPVRRLTRIGGDFVGWQPGRHSACTSRSGAATSRTTSSRADSLDARLHRARRLGPPRAAEWTRPRIPRAAVAAQDSSRARPAYEPAASTCDHGAEGPPARAGRAAQRARDHDEGRRGHRARRRGRARQPHRGGRARGHAAGAARAREIDDDRARRSCPDSWTRTRTCGPTGASTARSRGCTSRTSRTA